MMNYPEEFKQKVLAVFGNSEEMKARLDQGQEIVGRYLDDSRRDIPAEDVVKACESLDFKEIYAKAKRSVALEELYGEWSDLYHKQHEGMQR